LARLALTVGLGIVGAALAPFTAGTSIAFSAQFGFALGSLVGSVIGQLAFPGSGTHVTGPRVNDLQVSSSAPGTVIPFVFGSMRIGAQIIASQGIKEVTTTSNPSATGGPSNTQTTYSYFVTFAAAFCQGPATVTRIWGDAKLIMDKTGTGQLAKNLNVFPTLYTGSETQLADPLLASLYGAEKTPAYRGTCYAVWDQFPLANFGNRIPNIRGEVTSNATTSYPLATIPWTGGGSSQANYVITDVPGRTAFVWDGLGALSTPQIMRVDLATNTVVASGNLDMTALPGWTGSGTDAFGMYGGRATVDNDGYIWANCRLGVGQAGIVKIDPWSFKAIAFVNFHPGGSFAADTLSDPQALATYVAQDGSSYIVCVGPSYSGGNGICVVQCSTAQVLGQTYATFPSGGLTPPLAPGDSVITINTLQQYPVIDDVNGVAYLLYSIRHFPSSSTGDWCIARINMKGGTTLFLNPPFPNGPLFMDTQVFVYPSNSSRGVGHAMFWNPADSTLIVMTNGGAYLRIDPNTGSILEEVGSNSNRQFYIDASSLSWQDYIIGGNPGAAAFLAYCEGAGISYFGVQAAFKGRIQNGLLWAPSLTNHVHDVWAVSAQDFKTIATFDIVHYPVLSPSSNWPGASGSGSNAYAYDPVGNSLLAPLSGIGHPFYRCYLERISTGGLTADSIVRTICNNAGILDANIDVSAITGLSTLGYPVVQLQTGKDMIMTLASALFFEGRERDFKIEFISRGQSPIVDIDESELGLEADKCKLVETVGQEQDVPKDVEVIHIDPTIDYQQNKQHRIRHSRTKKTVNKTSVSLPLVMTAAQAVQLADKLMWNAEAERRSYKTNFWKAYWMLLDPCDVVTFTIDGSTLTARVVDSTIGQNFAVSMQLNSEDSANYLSSGVGNPGTGFVGQTIQGLAGTAFLILDMPYLLDTDADAAGNSGYYAVLYPGTGGTWGAGVLYSSSDGSTWNQVCAATSPAALGIAQNVLAAPRSPYSWDYKNSLTVRMFEGNAPSSDSVINVLNGTNVAILLPSYEVIQFETATANGDGTVTLTNLIRGVRGTEFGCGLHSVGELVVFPLISGRPIHEQVPLSVVGSARSFKGVTAGADVNSSSTLKSVTLQGNDLKPLAPSHFIGTRDISGNFSISWIRRSRLQGEIDWNDTITDVPLNEASELYDLEIINSSGVVLRTLSNLTSPSYSYLVANVIADYGSAVATVRGRVYQRSANVGRGFVSENDTIGAN
jgi:hypothetical protein